MKLYQSDCLEQLKKIEANSVDSLITDPPAGISFMGKDWDSDKGGRQGWIAWMTDVMRECHRVMKPGAHGLVWAIPRTSHWTATALEDAGFEVRDVITHLFGQGFPKSLDISKAIDKAAGAERERGPIKRGGERLARLEAGNRDGAGTWGDEVNRDPYTSIPSTDSAKEWSGWGTALKPASEHWILVRKPCKEKTVAANVLKWGAGGINVDGCRVEAIERPVRPAISRDNNTAFGAGLGAGTQSEPLGRFPANLVLSHTPHCADDQCDIECAIKALDEQSGTLKSGSRLEGTRKGLGYHGGNGDGGPAIEASQGGASRFFYCAKISRGERGEGNNHPTVKPQKLMRYLCRLITPPGGTVLDPFMGSGSTGIAAKAEGFGFIGIERETEYFEIARARIEAHASRD